MGGSSNLLMSPQQRPGLTKTLSQTILHYMVGSELQAKPSQAVLQLLKRSGLMTES